MLCNRRSFILALATILPTCASAQQPGSPMSPREQLKQYVADLQKNPSDDALREKIIRLVLTLDPKPANPPDLPETIGAATYAFKNAQSQADMQNAANLYAKAALEAPWRADLYFNEGLALGKAKRLDEALKAYQLYLLASPDATDADDVKEKIGALKYQLSQLQEKKRADQLQQEAERAREQVEEAKRGAEKQLDGRYVFHSRGGSSRVFTLTDELLDVGNSEVVYGIVLTDERGFPELANSIGVYRKVWTAPLTGRHFHYEESVGTSGRHSWDGNIAEDGKSIAVDYLLIDGWGNRIPSVQLFKRQ